MATTRQAPSDGHIADATAPGMPVVDVTAPGQRTADPSEQLDGNSPIRPTTVPGRGRSWWERFVTPSSVAVASWLVSLPAVFVLSRLAPFDPFIPRGFNSALAVGLAVACVLLFLAVRVSSNALMAGLAAGAWASWLAFLLRTALAGTPFAFGGVQGDAGRVSAMATRYSITPFSTDAFIDGIPSEYPMLFPWLIGRTSALLDIPAWRLVADFEIVTMSAAAIVGFLLWRRLVPAWVALAASSMSVLAFGDPRKAYEVITLAIFIPWALEALGRPPRGRMNWLLGGVLGGFVVMTYQGWFMFGFLALAGLIITTWRAEENRRAYALHVLKVAGTSAVVASWYLVPYIYGIVTIGTQSVADIYVPGSLHTEILPFLQEDLLSVVQIIGLVGVLWLRRSVWWASPLLWLIGGSFAYRVIAMLYFGVTKRTLLLHYTVHMYEMVMTIAGVLVIAYVAPLVLRRLALVPPRGVAATLLALVIVCTGYTYSRDWFPSAGRPLAGYVVSAHNEPLPTEGYPRFARSREVKRFPVAAIQQAVEAQLGPDPRKVTLAADERLFSFLPWPGYIGLSQSGSGSLVHWNDRYIEVKKLAATSDPAAFARATEETRFGRIDVFVLNRVDTNWVWRTVKFSPSQFDPASWTIVTSLPDDVVVAIRK